MNLPNEFSTLKELTLKKIAEGRFAFSDCLENLEGSLKLGLIRETLLVYLGDNFLSIFKLAEIGGLSEAMIVQLLQEKEEERSQTILRLNILTTWLSVNSVDAQVGVYLYFGNFGYKFNDFHAQVKEEVLGTLDFDHFTTK